MQRKITRQSGAASVETGRKPAWGTEIDWRVGY